MPKSTSVGVVFQPEIYEHLLTGFNFIVNAVKPTLGPTTRITAIEREVSRGSLPEMLDDGGIIARRIIQLENPDDDMGAMYLRHVLWTVHEKVGDGTATTAVMFYKLFTEGIRHITFGANSMRLRHFLEKGKQLILQEIEKQAVTIQTQQQMIEIAESICYDNELAEHLGKIYHIVGQHGRVEIREGYGRSIQSEFLDGMYWDSKLLTGEFGRSGHQKKIQFVDAALLASDINFDRHELIVPLIRELLQSGKKKLVLMGSEFNESVLSILNAVNRNKENIEVVAVKCPGMTNDEQAAYLQDIAIVTGAQPMISSAGYQIDRIRQQSLGYVRRAWADNDYFGIVGGQGNPVEIRKHVASLRRAVKVEEDKHLRQRHLKRVSILMGGSAVLRVTAPTPLEREERMSLAERTSDAMRGVVGSGIIPGGGVTLLPCRSVLEQLIDSELEFEERAAYQMLIKALEQPIRTIIANTGFSPEEIMAEIKYAGKDFGFDARHLKVREISEMGVWDSLSTLQTVVETAIHGAALALTIDAFIHRRKPEQAVEP